MTTNVFQVWSRECSVPLTIFAPSVDEAALIFQEWVRIHMPAWTNEPAQTNEVAPEWLADQPQLLEALRRAEQMRMYRGVLIFASHEAGWVPVPPFATAIGTIAPPEPAVRCFGVRGDKEDPDGVGAMVFAHDRDQALVLYRQWRERFFSQCDHAFTIDEFSRWTLTGGRTVLREQMDIGCVGIAGRSPEAGWSIYPANHEWWGSETDCALLPTRAPKSRKVENERVAAGEEGPPPRSAMNFSRNASNAPGSGSDNEGGTISSQD